MAVAEIPATAVEPTFVLHQIPGCGGKGLGEFLYGNFAVVHDEPDADVFGKGGDNPVLPLDTARLSAAHAFVFRGHFRPGSVFIEKLYPEFFDSPRFFTGIVLDDPIRAHATSYFHLRKRGEKLPPFGRFLSDKRDALCGYLGLRSEDEIVRALARYDFVGLAGPSLHGHVRRLAGELVGRLQAMADRANPKRTIYHLESWLKAEGGFEPEPEIEELVQSVGFVQRFLFNARNRLDVRLYRLAQSRC